MISIPEAKDVLTALGGRVRQARVRRGDSQRVFSQRIGISVPTLRAMERGDINVAIGHWVHAFWALGHLGDFGALLRQERGLIEQLEARRREKPRLRARRSTVSRVDAGSH